MDLTAKYSARNIWSFWTEQVWFEKQKELVPSHPSLIFFVKWIWMVSLQLTGVAILALSTERYSCSLRTHAAHAIRSCSGARGGAVVLIPELASVVPWYWETKLGAFVWCGEVNFVGFCWDPRQLTVSGQRRDFFLKKLGPTFEYSMFFVFFCFGGFRNIGRWVQKKS